MVIHSCDNTRCVNPEHLSLGTCQDNLQDMKSKQRHLYGEKNTQHKLTEVQVEQMHDLHASGLSTYKLAKYFGIGQMSAWRIVNGERWNHVYLRRHGLSESM